MASLINLALMQLTWFACVLGAANNAAWLGVVVSLVVALFYLWRAVRPDVDLKLLLASLAVGLVLDSTISLAGLMTFASGELVSGFTTPWMLGLWLGFATTLTGSLRWLMRRPLVAMAFGAIGGPTAYWSGAKLGALTLNDVPLALCCIGVEWAVAMWLFVRLTAHFARDTSPISVAA